MHLPVVLSIALAVLLCCSPVSAQGTVTDTEWVQRAAQARLIGIVDDPEQVTILEFFDYACSTCQQFHVQRGDSLRSLLEEEGVALSMHSYVIPRLPRGYPAAEAALCAGAVGGPEGWAAMHDRLARNTFAWRREGAGPEPFVRWAVEFGLDEALYADCLHRDVPAPLVFTDAQLAARFEVAGTPAFVFIPGGATESAQIVSFFGNEPMSRFREALEEARARAR